nr:hypothetical protein [Tanacetum cinerariifolium]
MGNVKKFVAERTRHQRQYDRRVNKRQMQTQESMIDMGKAVDADLVITESSGTESKVQDDSSPSGNDTDADDADIRPIYDEEPMVEPPPKPSSAISRCCDHHPHHLPVDSHQHLHISTPPPSHHLRCHTTAVTTSLPSPSHHHHHLVTTVTPNTSRPSSRSPHPRHQPTHHTTISTPPPPMYNQKGAFGFKNNHKGAFGLVAAIWKHNKGVFGYRFNCSRGV